MDRNASKNVSTQWKFISLAKENLYEIRRARQNCLKTVFVSIKKFFQVLFSEKMEILADRAEFQSLKLHKENGS